MKCAWVYFLVQKSFKKHLTMYASAGSRTRIDCLEGNHAYRYTTDADVYVFACRELKSIQCYQWEWKRLGQKSEKRVHSSLTTLAITLLLDSVAQWIARRTSSGFIAVIRRLWVRVPPESLIYFWPSFQYRVSVEILEITSLKHDINMNASTHGRVVKALDLKSNGRCPRRFKSCWVRFCFPFCFMFTYNSFAIRRKAADNVCQPE